MSEKRKIDETVEWIVSYYSPLYGVTKTGKFKDEVTLIKRTTTIKDIEEYA